MRAPASEVLLSVWEAGHQAHPIERALTVLGALWPEWGTERWRQASIGQRDGGLLAVHEALFGAEMATTTRCPRCSARLESAVMTADLRTRPVALTLAEAPHRLTEQGYQIDYRLPTSEDLLTVIAGDGDAETAARTLLQRCVLGASHGGRPVDSAELPASVVAELGEEMNRQDPEAEIRLGFTCPGCGHAWRACFDIVAHLWAAIAEWAQRLLLDVHVLAGAYGWSESGILALSPERRQLYVDMVRA